MASYEPVSTLCSERHDAGAGIDIGIDAFAGIVASEPTKLNNINNNNNNKAPHLVRHYSSIDLSTPAAVSLATDIFNLWDHEHNGQISPSQITLTNIDDKFLPAIVRVLAPYNANTIYKENVIECVSVLQHGDLSSKVKLLVQFMDSDGNQLISFEELQEYLKVSDQTMMEKLGLIRKRRIQSLTPEEFHSVRSAAVDTDGNALHGVVTTVGDELRYEDFLSLFQESDRGLEAINVFCEQILRIFKHSVQQYRLQQRNGQQQGQQPGNKSFLTRHLSFRTLTATESLDNTTSSDSSSKPTCCTTNCNAITAWCSNTCARLQNLSHIDKFKVWLLFFQCALWLIHFFDYKRNGFPLAICFAKGFGLNLRILTLLMYLTMARTTLGHLYSIRIIRWLIPLGENMIEIHSFLGFAIAIHMFGHTFGHIAYQTMYTVGFQHSFQQPSLLTGKNTFGTLWSGDGITGFILLFLILFMAITACFRSFSSKYYQLFAITHYSYLLYLPFMFLHVPRLWPYFLAIGALLIIERLWDLSHNTIFTTLKQSRPCRNGITYISVPRYGMMTYPGSYYRIKIPSLSMHEWHPFSLAGSTSSHHLAFFIASTGDWTSALYDLVKDSKRRSQTLIQVQGPFLAPASQALIRKPGTRILCVASGIGITPFFSVMATKVADEVNFENDRILYEKLFQESSNPMGDGGMGHGAGHMQHQNSLFHALMEAHAQPSKQHHHHTRRPSTGGSSIELIGEAAVLHDLEAGVSKSNSEAKNVATPAASRSKSCSHDSDDEEDDDNVSEEEDSLLKVVWSIRDVKQLMFYLDYVHHLVKSQDQLHHQDEKDDASSPRNGKGQTTSRRKRIVVEVEVYLTGLGSKSDPVYMLSQTLFLLSMANQSSNYMKIHFGRADLEKIVQSFGPEEVYYCGGNPLKEKLHDICSKERIPFYPEAFDSGGGAAMQAYRSLSKSLSGGKPGKGKNPVDKSE